jgi:hypothetical protein
MEMIYQDAKGGLRFFSVEKCPEDVYDIFEKLQVVEVLVYEKEQE